MILYNVEPRKFYSETNIVAMLETLARDGWGF
jgi:hypothetical protein